MANEPTIIEPQPPNPLTILEAALARGIDADQLGKLVAMQEQWTKDRAREAFSAAMTACQGEIEAVVCDAENPKTHSKFALLETVQRIAKPVYAKHGFALSFSEGKSNREGHMRVVCQVSHVQGDMREHWIELPYDGTGARGNVSAMNAVQAVGSTFSYGCRYLIVRIFNLTIAREDTDGNDQTELVTPAMIEQINEAWEECQAAGLKLNWPKFLAWLGVKELGELPAADFAKAIGDLNRKRRAAKAKE